MDVVAALAPVALLALLALGVFAVRTRAFVAEVQELAGGMDPAMRPVAVACVVFTIGVAIALVARGVPASGAVAAALLTGGGALSFTLGAFGLQGLMLETDSQRLLRVRAGEPIASTRRGRIVAMTLGLIPFAGWIAWCLLVP